MAFRRRSRGRRRGFTTGRPSRGFGKRRSRRTRSKRGYFVSRGGIRM